MTEDGGNGPDMKEEEPMFSPLSSCSNKVCLVGHDQQIHVNFSQDSVYSIKKKSTP